MVSAAAKSSAAGEVGAGAAGLCASGTRRRFRGQVSAQRAAGKQAKKAAESGPARDIVRGSPEPLKFN